MYTSSGESVDSTTYTFRSVFSVQAYYPPSIHFNSQSCTEARQVRSYSYLNLEVSLRCCTHEVFNFLSCLLRICISCYKTPVRGLQRSCKSPFSYHHCISKPLDDGAQPGVGTVLRAAAADCGVLLLPYFAECNTLNGLVSEVFIRFFVETVGHYSLFLTQNEKGERVFQREAFRKSVASKSIRRFLEVFMESQMFAGFIQDRELRKCRAKGKGADGFVLRRGQSRGAARGSSIRGRGRRDLCRQSAFRLSFLPSSVGLFEQRVEQYLEELPDTEQSGVNKFLRGLGEQTV